MRILICGAAVLALIATPVTAAPRPVAKAIAAKTLRGFHRADTDRSRSLSPEEFTAAGGQEAGFEALDVNNDGSIGYFELVRGVLLRLKVRMGAGA